MKSSRVFKKHQVASFSEEKEPKDFCSWCCFQKRAGWLNWSGAETVGWFNAMVEWRSG